MTSIRDNVAKLAFLFSATKPTYSIPGNSILPLYHLIEALITQVVVDPALHYREQVLYALPSGFFMILNATVQPTDCSPHRFANPRTHG